MSYQAKLEETSLSVYAEPPEVVLHPQTSFGVNMRGEKGLREEAWRRKSCIILRQEDACFRER